MGTRYDMCPWCGAFINHQIGGYSCARGYDPTTDMTCGYNDQHAQHPIKLGSPEHKKVKSEYKKKCKKIKAEREKNDPIIQLAKAEKECVKAAIKLLRGGRGTLKAVKDAAEQVTYWRARKAVRNSSKSRQSAMPINRASHMPVRR